VDVAALDENVPNGWHESSLSGEDRLEETEMALKQGWEGRFYEDFEVGDVYQRPYGRTISETDNTWITLLTLNSNPIHFDINLASQSNTEGMLVNSGLTLALAVGMSVMDTSQNAFANLGWEEIRLPHPVFVGDTLYVESRVLAIRDSRSRPHAGIVKVETRGLNQHGDECIVFTRSFFVPKRGTGDSHRFFPTPKDPWPDSE
jgi:itaconyl-CoA hydratase